MSYTREEDTRVCVQISVSHLYYHHTVSIREDNYRPFKFVRHNSQVIFGVKEGKVKIGQLKTNKTSTLFVHSEGSQVVSLCSFPERSSILSGHLDGSIFIFEFVDGLNGITNRKVVQHSCSPFALGWGRGGVIIVGGFDGTPTFYDESGKLLGQMKYFQTADSSEANTQIPVEFEVYLNGALN